MRSRRSQRLATLLHGYNRCRHKDMSLAFGHHRQIREGTKGDLPSDYRQCHRAVGENKDVWRVVRDGQRRPRCAYLVSPSLKNARPIDRAHSLQPSRLASGYGRLNQSASLSRKQRLSLDAEAFMAFGVQWRTVGLPCCENSTLIDPPL